MLIQNWNIVQNIEISHINIKPYAENRNLKQSLEIKKHKIK